MPINPFKPMDPEQGQKMSDEQKEARQEKDMLYQAVFGTPQGQAVLKDLEKRMEQEDVPIYDMQHVNEFMHYCSGRRSIVKYIRQRIERIKEGK